MAITINSKVKELLANEKTCAVLEKFMPGISTDSQVKMAYGMSFKAMCGFPQTGVSKEKLAEIAAELEAVGE